MGRAVPYLDPSPSDLGLFSLSRTAGLLLPLSFQFIGFDKFAENLRGEKNNSTQIFRGSQGL